MLDTIRAYTYVDISWFSELKGWEKDKNERGIPFKKKNVYLKNGASVFMRYYPCSCYLTIQFSASKVQNGNNSISYDYSKSYLVEEAIAHVLADNLYIGYDTSDFKLSRMDLNKDFVFHDDETAIKVCEFANKILPARCEKRVEYDTGYTSQSKKGKGLRVYRKDKDENLAEEQRTELPPTVRFEFEMNKNKLKRVMRYQYNLHQILTLPHIAAIAWNRLLSEYALDKKILPQGQLYRDAGKCLTNYELATLKQMNEGPSFNDKQLRIKHLVVIRKLKKHGICPYSCEVSLKFTNIISNTIETIHRKKNDLCRQHRQRRNYALIDTNKTVKRWYLDSS